MNYVKSKATTKAKVHCKQFEAVESQFLLDIKGVKMVEEIPDELVVIN